MAVLLQEVQKLSKISELALDDHEGDEVMLADALQVESIIGRGNGLGLRHHGRRGKIKALRRVTPSPNNINLLQNIFDKYAMSNKNRGNNWSSKNA